MERTTAIRLAGLQFRLRNDGTWRSPVAHCNGVAGVAGSNPAVPMGTEPTARGRLCRDRIHRTTDPPSPRGAACGVTTLALFALFLSACGDGPTRRPAESGGAMAIDSAALTKTASGLQYQDIVVGTGPEAAPGQIAVVHYTGWLTDGKKFDSSRDRGEPFEFPLGGGQVIAGWDQGVAGMKVGGQRKLVIPLRAGLRHHGEPAGDSGRRDAGVRRGAARAQVSSGHSQSSSRSASWSSSSPSRSRCSGCSRGAPARWTPEMIPASSGRSRCRAGS